MARTNLMVITYATKHGTDVLFAKTKHPPIPRQHLMWGNTPDSLPKIDEHILRRLGCDEPDLGWESAYYYEIFDVATLEDQIDFDSLAIFHDHHGVVRRPMLEFEPKHAIERHGAVQIGDADTNVIDLLDRDRLGHRISPRLAHATPARS